MTTLRERLAGVLLRDELSEIRDLAEALNDVYARRNLISGDLSEMDERTMDLVMRHAGDTPLIGTAQMTQNDAYLEQTRRAAVAQARLLVRNDVVTRAVIRLWTDFGFGQHIEITPRSRTADRVWTEFESAPRNRTVMSRRAMPRLSNKLLVDGELFLAYFASRVDGTTTVRIVRPEEITDLISHPDDHENVLYYRRQYSVAGDDPTPRVLYYPNYQADADDLARYRPTDGVIASDESPLTDVTMMHVSFEPQDLRGWPLMSAGAPWSIAYRNFLSDRVAVVAAVARFVDKVASKGGSRSVIAMRQKLESAMSSFGADGNTQPLAGSTWISNEAVDRTRMPLTTGAGDAATDGLGLISQAGLGGGVYPQWLGRGDTTSITRGHEMESPMERMWTRYQALWSDVFRDMVEIVLHFKELYGGMRFANREVDVSTDSLLQVNLDSFSRSVALLTDRGILPLRVGMEQTLQAFNVKNVNSIVREYLPKAEELQRLRVQLMQRGAPGAETVGAPTPEGDGAVDPTRASSQDNEDTPGDSVVYATPRPNSSSRVVQRTKEHG
jgi:hypothetical protein